MSLLSVRAWATTTVWQARPIGIVTGPESGPQRMRQRSVAGWRPPTSNGRP